MTSTWVVEGYVCEMFVEMAVMMAMMMTMSLSRLAGSIILACHVAVAFIVD